MIAEQLAPGDSARQELPSKLPQPVVGDKVGTAVGASSRLDPASDANLTLGARE